MANPRPALDSISFIDRGQHVGQPLAAVHGIGVEPDPAARRIGGEGVLETLGRGHLAVFEAAALGIAQLR